MENRFASGPNGSPEVDPFRELFARMLLKCLDLKIVTVDEVEHAVTACLTSECPGCRSRLESYAAVLAGIGASRAKRDPYDRLFELGSAVRATATKRRPSGTRQARREQAVTALHSLTHHQRLEQIQLRHYYFRGAEAAKLFLREARALLPANPPESARFAEYAELAAGIDRPLPADDPADLLLLGFRSDLYKANALRCAGELDAASLAFDQSLEGARKLGVMDLLFWAEAKFFRASLLRAQRRFSEALQAARVAGAFFGVLGEKTLEVQVRLTICTIHEHQGDFRAALASVREALPAVCALHSPEIRLHVQHAEVLYLVRSGDAASARSRFEALASLYDQFPSRQPWRLWAAALIAAQLCEHSVAALAFETSRGLFIAACNPYDAALVTIDYSLFLLDQNRPEEVLPLAISMGQAFEALGVARETLASWAIFQTAAERRELTRAVAESMVRTLGEERAGPKPGR